MPLSYWQQQATTKQFVKLADEVSVIAARVGKYGFKEKSRVGLKLRLLKTPGEQNVSRHLTDQ